MNKIRHYEWLQLAVQRESVAALYNRKLFARFTTCNYFALELLREFVHLKIQRIL